MFPDSVADRPEAWPVLDSTDLHRDAWVVALRSDRVHRPGHDHEVFRRLVVEHPGAVVVLALDDQERVFCLGQYRHAPGRRFIELPAGLCDVPGEDPLAVAQRELVEEAGLTAREWSHLLTSYPSPGISNELVHVYVARGLTPADRGEFAPDAEEADMTTGWVRFAELRNAVVEGRVASGSVVMAVLMYETRRRLAARESSAGALGE